MTCQSYYGTPLIGLWSRTCGEPTSISWKRLSARMGAYAEQVRAIIDSMIGEQNWEAVDDALFENL